MKKTKTLGILLAFVLIACMLMTTPIAASAAETGLQGGLEATLLTDKDDYSVGEDIVITVVAKNTNSFDISNADVAFNLPDGLTLKSGDLSISNIDIAAGETYSAEIVAIKEEPTLPEETTGAAEEPTEEPSAEPTEEPTAAPTQASTVAPTEKPTDNLVAAAPVSDGKSGGGTNAPKTGDNMNVLLWIGLFVSSACVFLAVRFRKGAAKFLSLFLCVAMLCSITPIGALAADTNSDTGSDTGETIDPFSVVLDKIVTVDGDEYCINAAVSYLNGGISGKICKASDRATSIPNATINIYKDGVLFTSLTDDETGNYSAGLPAGDYFVEIKAEGYLDFQSYASVTEGRITFMETFLMIEEADVETGIAAGTVIDQLTGVGCEGVTLTVHKNWNNPDEYAETVGTTTTDENGKYTIELPLGNYTVVASKEEYLPSSFNIIVQPGTTDNQNGVISPIVSGDQYLITLTWGKDPEDVDSHVVGTLSNGDLFHVYWNDESAYDGDEEICNLDYDDTESYGPEHITLTASGANPYYYYVEKYFGEGTLASSGAKVTVHKGNVLIAEYNIPTNKGSDDCWNVFAIKNGELITRNTITESADTSYAD